MAAFWTQRTCRAVLLITVGAAGATAQSPVEKGRRLGLLIGVNQHVSEPPLAYCANDARLLRERLVRYGEFAPGDITLLLDESPDRYNQPTGGVIRDRLRQLLDDANPEDTVLVFFAGHGVQYATEKGRRGYILPIDGASEQSALAIDELREAFERSPAQNKLLILDACRNDVSGEQRGTRGLEREWREQAAGKSFVTIFACSGGERSHESAELRQGVFTNYFAEALTGAADSNGDNIVNAREAFDYAAERTREHARQIGRVQKPEIVIATDLASKEIALGRRIAPADDAVAKPDPAADGGGKPPAAGAQRPAGGAAAAALDRAGAEALALIAVNEDDPARLATALAVPGVVDARGPGGESLLHRAAFRGSSSVVPLLLRAGAAINAQDANQYTPLHMACERGRTAVVRQLLAGGARVDGQVVHHGFSALHLVADHDRAADVIPLLLAAGAALDGRDQRGRTALHVAARAHAAIAVQALLNAGADPNAQDKQGNTPLHAAIDGVSKGGMLGPAVRVIDLLLANRADPRLPNEAGATPESAAQARNLLAIMERIKAGGSGR